MKVYGGSDGCSIEKVVFTRSDAQSQALNNEEWVPALVAGARSVMYAGWLARTMQALRTLRDVTDEFLRRSGVNLYTMLDVRAGCESELEDCARVTWHTDVRLRGGTVDALEFTGRDAFEAYKTVMIGIATLAADSGSGLTEKLYAQIEYVPLAPEVAH